MSQLMVNAIECPICKNVIYSRARHDLRTCSCGACHVDGGRDYQRVGFKGPTPPRSVEIGVLATERELYDDWNFRREKYGRIHCESK
jgi:hypothetical protein